MIETLSSEGVSFCVLGIKIGRMMIIRPYNLILHILYCLHNLSVNILDGANLLASYTADGMP